MGNKITTTSDPTGDTDLRRKKYVDDQDAKKLSLTGGTMNGALNMGSNKITTSYDPVDDNDLCRLNYVDREIAVRLSVAGGIMLGDIEMGTNKITTTVDPVSDKDLSRKKYVDDELKKNFDKTGGNITGRVNLKQDIYMDTGKYIHNLMTTVPSPNVLISKGFADSRFLYQGGYLNKDFNTGQYQFTTEKDPIFPNNLTRKKYVDNQDAKKLSLTGGTMTGDLNMGSNKIIKNSDPTRKKYVDMLVDNKTEMVRTALKNTAYQLNIIQSYILNSDFNFYGEIYDLTDNRIEIWYNQSKILQKPTN